MKSELFKNSEEKLEIVLKLSEKEYNTLFTAFGVSTSKDREKNAVESGIEILNIYEAGDFYSECLYLRDVIITKHLNNWCKRESESVAQTQSYTFNPKKYRVTFDEALAHYQDGGTIQCLVLDEEGYVAEVEHYHKNSGLEICLEFNEILNGHWFLC